MILYHFTAMSMLDAILREGLTRGDVPLTAEDGINAVWFTTDPEPSGHGLSDGGPLSPEMVAEVERRTGRKFPDGIGTPDKRRVRISVVISSRDATLKQWLPFARKRLSSDWLDALHSAAGGKPKARTWFIYLGTVPAERFRSVEVRGADGSYAPMSDADRAEAAQTVDVAPRGR